MSIELMVTVLHGASDLDPQAKLILLGIANHAGDGGAWPSVTTLSRYANCSARTIQRRLKQLDAEGYIVIHKQAGGTADTRRDRRPNLYVIQPDRVVHTPKPNGVTQGVTPSSNGVTRVTERGDTAMSPEPSINPDVKQIGDMTYAGGEQICFEDGCQNKAAKRKTRCIPCQNKLADAGPFV